MIPSRATKEIAQSACLYGARLTSSGLDQCLVASPKILESQKFTADGFFQVFFLDVSLRRCRLHWSSGFQVTDEEAVDCDVQLSIQLLELEGESGQQHDSLYAEPNHDWLLGVPWS